jgi:hypothetical protein
MDIRKVENRTPHTFVEQLTRLLSIVFPKHMGGEIEYFVGEIGEETDSNIVRGLCFKVNFETTGTIYMSFEELKEWEVPEDFEDEFFKKISDDILISGILHLNANSQASFNMEKNIIEADFKNSVPGRLIFLN